MRTTGTHENEDGEDLIERTGAEGQAADFVLGGIVADEPLPTVAGQDTSSEEESESEVEPKGKGKAPKPGKSNRGVRPSKEAVLEESALEAGGGGGGGGCLKVCGGVLGGGGRRRGGARGRGVSGARGR